MTRTTRYDRVLSLLPSTLDWSISQDVDAVKDYLLSSQDKPRIFLGSGGSLSAAMLAMQLSVECGIVAAAMTPYQYIFSPWSRLRGRVLLFSAGGRNVDAINSYRNTLHNESQTFGAMLMTRRSPLEEMVRQDGASHIYAYDLHNSDGFLATNSLVAFYALLFRIYRGDTVMINDWSFTDTLQADIRQFMASTYSLPTDDWDRYDAALYEARETDRFYVLYPPDAMPVAYDLESRFAEGSLGCIQISDYRNFAHGRFNWFDQRKGQTAILALITPESSDVAESILGELPQHIPVMRISTSVSGSEGIIELLIKGMYATHCLGQRWGLDIGAPRVADFGRIIHRKDFNITYYK